MAVKDGPSCPGCGLANYDGMCPHCRGDQAAYEHELVPPFESSLPKPCPMGCGHTTEDPYGGPCKACWDVSLSDALSDPPGPPLWGQSAS